jgi:hypothetical protein
VRTLAILTPDEWSPWLFRWRSRFNIFLITKKTGRNWKTIVNNQLTIVNHQSTIVYE